MEQLFTGAATTILLVIAGVRVKRLLEVQLQRRKHARNLRAAFEMLGAARNYRAFDPAFSLKD